MPSRWYVKIASKWEYRSEGVREVSRIWPIPKWPAPAKVLADKTKL